LYYKADTLNSAALNVNGTAERGLPLQNKKMATLFRNNSRSQERVIPALGDKSKIYLQPLHIKFGLLKMSVRAMDRESERFA
jgi:hypothetical protein